MTELEATLICRRRIRENATDWAQGWHTDVLEERIEDLKDQIEEHWIWIEVLYGQIESQRERRDAPKG